MRKTDSRRQASEAHRGARDKKGDTFFVARATLKFCSGGDKMRNASGHQSNAKVKMDGSELKV